MHIVFARKRSVSVSALGVSDGVANGPREHTRRGDLPVNDGLQKVYQRSSGVEQVEQHGDNDVDFARGASVTNCQGNHHLDIAHRLGDRRVSRSYALRWTLSQAESQGAKVSQHCCRSKMSTYLAQPTSTVVCRWQFSSLEFRALGESASKYSRE